MSEAKDGKNKNRAERRAPPPKPSAFITPPCWYCRSDETFVYTTRGETRYCKCAKCGETFCKVAPRQSRRKLT